MTVLDAYLEGVLYGRFERTNNTVTFIYRDDAPATPISLSLPRDGSATKAAAGNLLENLLPDRDEVRHRMASHFRTASTDSFDLLAAAGGDVAGGLVLAPEGQPPFTPTPDLDPALDRDIAQRIASLKRDPDAWIPEAEGARFSLGGTQGKFALARLDGDWYWSNSGVPSTHIIKPGAPRLAQVEEAEISALTLADAVGVPAARAQKLIVKDQTAFIVERFDRTLGPLTATRVHTEDLAQAFGAAPDTKYNHTALQVLTLLNGIDGADPELRWQFLRQLVFNTIIGNADAHAKNYSVILRPGQVTLAPLYDSIPVLLYPEYNQDLAMDISGAVRPAAADLDHWRKLAQKADLDIDRAEAEVTSLADRIADANDDAWNSLTPTMRDRVRTAIARNTAVAQTSAQTRAAAAAATHAVSAARPRTPRGVPGGGEWTAKARPEADIELG